MRVKTITLLRRWLHHSPNSHHPMDDARFYDLIVEAMRNNELDELLCIDLEKYLKEKHPQLSNERMGRFVEKWENNISLCVNLIQYIQNQGYL